MSNIPEINPKRHAIERYIERFKNVKFKNQSEFNAYIHENSESLKKEIKSIFKESKLFSEGVVGNIKNRSKCYLYKNIVFVTDFDNNLVSMYKVNFEFGEEDDIYLANRLMQKINIYNEFIEEERESSKEKAEELSTKMEYLKQRRKEIEIQLKITNEEISECSMAISNTANRQGELESQKREAVLKLINYRQYCNDMKNK